ncbi:hypothetical protein EIP86_005288 [Pleurotus ostreatoroseus]|nr:hypothetical protein EIP86_005288 [Pleurotus ostreatoroseus]
MDDMLRIASAEAITLLSEIPVEDRTWEKVLSTLAQSPFMKRAEDLAVDKTDLWTKEQTNAFSLSSSEDPIIVKEADGWLRTLIVDPDIWETSHLSFGVITTLVAEIGTAVESLWQLINDKTQKDRTVVDIGILRFPDPDNPYFKIYRIHLKAWISQERHFIRTKKICGISGSFNSRKFVPREDKIKSAQAEAQKKLVERADAIFSASLDSSSSSPDIA